MPYTLWLQNPRGSEGNRRARKSLLVAQQCVCNCMRYQTRRNKKPNGCCQMGAAKWVLPIVCGCSRKWTTRVDELCVWMHVGSTQSTTLYILQCILSPQTILDGLPSSLQRVENCLCVLIIPLSLVRIYGKTFFC